MKVFLWKDEYYSVSVLEGSEPRVDVPDGLIDELNAVWLLMDRVQARIRPYYEQQEAILKADRDKAYQDLGGGSVWIVHGET